MSQRELPDEHACDGRVLERRPVFFFFFNCFSQVVLFSYFVSAMLFPSSFSFIFRLCFSHRAAEAQG